jgi:SAM-dependent methyltransferase
MPTLPSSPGSSRSEPHRARQVAESFGSDPERYDRTRPRYPQALIDRIIASTPGRDVLDVGIGTGVSAQPFQTAGYRVLGVEVDPRMAQLARDRGFAVEIAKFEDWDPIGRSFDAVISGMTWHWVDPAAGAAKAAEVLRTEGPLALFWNVHQPPPDLANAFAEVYRRVLPDTPFAALPRDPVAGHSQILDAAAAGITASGGFDVPKRLRFDWERDYTRDQWLDQVPTFGGHSTFAAEKLDRLLTGIATTIDHIGGSFTMHYAAMALIAPRLEDRRASS